MAEAFREKLLERKPSSNYDWINKETLVKRDRVCMCACEKEQRATVALANLFCSLGLDNWRPSSHQLYLNFAGKREKT